MANVTFTHPLLPNPLEIDTNPDQVIWEYGLNTQSYPTYGGEVVQILSVYFGDMTVGGTVSSYQELESIYSWFIAYMQYATQGRDNPSYDQQPVTFTYAERGWTFTIWPRMLPGFKYGRDVVAPTWTLVAAVKEPDATMAQQIQSYAAFNAAHTSGPISQFGKATANFGSTGDLTSNPWASPDGAAALQGQTVSQWAAKQTSDLADTYSGFVNNLSAGQLTSLPQFADISKPAPTPAQKSTGKSKKQGQVKSK